MRHGCFRDCAESAIIQGMRADCEQTVKDPAMAETFLQAAIEEARKGLAEGGIPIGSVLVIDDQIVGRGHDRRLQAVVKITLL